jgi:hypothetical protein
MAWFLGNGYFTRAGVIRNLPIVKKALNIVFYIRSPFCLRSFGVISAPKGERFSPIPPAGQ